MLWYCRFKWHSSTTASQVRQRVLQQHEAGTNHPERIKGWYNLVGGGAGFLLVESNDPREVTEMFTPYMDLMDVDVHGCYELPYEQTIQAFRQSEQQPAGQR